jgi:outer membrane protease
MPGMSESTLGRPSISLFRAEILACILLCAIARNAIGEAAPKDIRISTATTAGILYGSSRELVYNQHLSANYKNSELIWPLEPLFYAGAGLALQTGSGIFASLDLRQGFAGKNGAMTDSDFLNGDGVRTHFSQSDGYVERALLLDLKLGYDFRLASPIKLRAYAGFSYMDFKWSARDGYYQYPDSGSDYYYDGSGFHPGTYTPWSASETKTPIYGTGILYEQAYLLGSLGLGASYSLLPGLVASASFSFSPLAFCYTEDNHELRLVDFYSKLSGGLMLEPGLGLEYSLRPGASLRLDLAWLWLGNLKGDIIQVDQGTTSTSSGGNYFAGPDSASLGKNDSGAALSMLDASLMFKLAF